MFKRISAVAQANGRPSGIAHQPVTGTSDQLQPSVFTERLCRHLRRRRWLPARARDPSSLTEIPLKSMVPFALYSSTMKFGRAAWTVPVSPGQMPSCLAW